MSLTVFSAVRRSISSTFFSPTPVWFATARSSSASSAVNSRSLARQQRTPSCSSPIDQGRRQQRVLVELGQQVSRGLARAPAPAAVGALHQVEHQPVPPGRELGAAALSGSERASTSSSESGSSR